MARRGSILRLVGCVVGVAGRVLRRGLTGVSVVLLLATLAAWGRGYWSSDSLVVRRESLDDRGWRSAGWRLSWGGGDLGVCHGWESDDGAWRRAHQPVGVRWKSWFGSFAPSRVTQRYVDQVAEWRHEDVGLSCWNHAGAVLAWKQRTPRMKGPVGFVTPYRYDRFLWLAAPCWMPAVLFSVLPAWRGWACVRRRRLRRRERAGLCAHCGYDLRATPEGGGELVGRCPECGRDRGG